MHPRVMCRYCKKANHRKGCGEMSSVRVNHFVTDGRSVSQTVLASNPEREAKIFVCSQTIIFFTRHGTSSLTRRRVCLVTSFILSLCRYVCVCVYIYISVCVRVYTYICTEFFKYMYTRSLSVRALYRSLCLVLTDICYLGYDDSLDASRSFA